jgi:hypothetical protein
MLKGRIFAATILATIAFLVAVGTAGAAVSGENTILDQRDGRIFIPLRDRTSGDLADGFGTSANQVIFGPPGQRTAGRVSFALGFDLTSEFPEGFFVDPAGTSLLVITLTDLDFRPVNVSGVRYSETLALSFMPDADGEPPETPDLVIDADNYGNFTVGFVRTNRTTLEYTINLQQDLGLTQADFDAMNADKEFGLHVTLGSEAINLLPGPRLYRSQAETIRGGDFVGFGAIPEPATLGLFVPGVLLLARRRRR